MTKRSTSPFAVPIALALLIGVGISAVLHADANSSFSVIVTVSESPKAVPISPSFLGLSYESSSLLPTDGHYYFDPNNTALVTLFHTLGVKSLRVGANAVDDPRIAIPQEKDIDSLFAFARAAGVKVIYSFRLNKGDPAVAARLAKYISTHYADALDCFAIGNEPEYFVHPFSKYLAMWKPHYDAILKAVPNAMFDAPSGNYCLPMAKAMFGDGHLKMVSSHHYFLGSGRGGEKDPAATRAKFLSNDVDEKYAKQFASLVTPLIAMKAPYRIDEMNSCYNGGAKGSSDTYASTLWALDCMNWWASHGIVGMNFHTGDSVGRDGGFGAPNYAMFVRKSGGDGFEIRPQAYAMLAFAQTVRGTPMEVKANAPAGFDFNAYAYEDGDTVYCTLINKSFGANGNAVEVSLNCAKANAPGRWNVTFLSQKASDISATTDVTLGFTPIGPDGSWAATSVSAPTVGGNNAPIAIKLPAASAVLMRFTRINLKLPFAP